MHRPKVIVASVVVLALVALGIILATRKSGPLRVDKHGVASGSGQKTYRYRNGATKLVEDYIDGKQVRSEWFRPDGTSILITQWQDESGTGLYLREDGSIRRQQAYVRGLAHGPGIYYNRDGSVRGEALFEDGGWVSGYKPQPGDDD